MGREKVDLFSALGRIATVSKSQSSIFTFKLIMATGVGGIGAQTLML